MATEWISNAKYIFPNLYANYQNWTMRVASLNQGHWNHLPDVVLTELFKYLPDKDRARAARVCQNWCRIFESPCLWRSRTFEMGGFRAQLHGIRACRFAERFGKYLRYLFITCSHPSYHTCKMFQRAIEELFLKLKEEGTQLTEFEMCRLELERYWKYDTPREKLVSIFSKFLKTQNRLQCFDMSSAQFPAYGGVRVLDSLAYHSGASIQDMLIEDFFHARLSVYQVKKFVKVIGKFTNLKYLALNYNCLSEEVIDACSKSLKNKLEFLNIKVFRNDPHFHRISGQTWKQVTRACPKLRVAFWIESIGAYSEIAPLLVKEAPVKDVHLWTGYDDDADWRLGDTFTHIADSYAKSLEHVSFELDNTQEIVDIQLLHLVTKCKKLKELSMNAMVGIETIQELCELQREKKIDLVYLHMTCCGLSDMEWAALVALRERYQPIMAKMVDFKLTTDLLIEPEIGF